MRICRQVSRCYAKLQQKNSRPGNSIFAFLTSLPPPSRPNPNVWTVTVTWSGRPVRSSLRRTVRALLCSSALSFLPRGPFFFLYFFKKSPHRGQGAHRHHPRIFGHGLHTWVQRFQQQHQHNSPGPPPPPNGRVACGGVSNRNSRSQL